MGDALGGLAVIAGMAMLWGLVLAVCTLIAILADGTALTSKHPQHPGNPLWVEQSGIKGRACCKGP